MSLNVRQFPAMAVAGIRDMQVKMQLLQQVRVMGLM
jgi:hypothetical protein